MNFNEIVIGAEYSGSHAGNPKNKKRQTLSHFKVLSKTGASGGSRGTVQVRVLGVIAVSEYDLSEYRATPEDRQFVLTVTALQILEKWTATEFRLAEKKKAQEAARAERQAAAARAAAAAQIKQQKWDELSERYRALTGTGLPPSPKVNPYQDLYTSLSYTTLAGIADGFEKTLAELEKRYGRATTIIDGLEAFDVL